MSRRSRCCAKTMIKTYAHIKNLASQDALRKIKVYVFLCILASVLEAYVILQIGPVIESLISLPSGVAEGIHASGKNDNYIYYLFLGLVLGVTTARIGILFLQSRIAFNLGAEVQQSVVLKVLRDPWLYEARSDSDLISLTAMKSERLIRETVLQFLMIINSCCIIFSIVLGLMLTNAVVTSIAVVSVGGTYALIVAVSRLWIARASRKIAKAQDLNNSLLEDVFKAKLEINLYSRASGFYLNLDHVVKDYRLTQSSVHLLASWPRFLIEGFALAGFVLLIILSDGLQGNTQLIGFIGVLAFTAQRIMPLVQVMYAGKTAISGNNYAVEEFIEVLGEQATDKLLELENEFCSIEFTDVTILNCDFVNFEPISLIASAGDLVVIKGDSGIGKSTFLKVLLGWDDLKFAGDVSINNEVINLEKRLIRNKIAYVPQRISILSQSLDENITLTFNQDEVDELALQKAIDSTGLSLFSHLDIFNETRLSHGKLSGGQLQRIAIARALYSNRSLILMDEATDGLDEKSERIILTNIKNNYPNAIIFLISHKKSAADLADKVLEFKSKN
ncbi:ABC transporter ATP-binding protein/permease [Alphaproteobacteria bacterium]|nr:ABC transporter ATP-binding protein/permease [Alphaproteobacteria bacterium]